MPIVSVTIWRLRFDFLMRIKPSTKFGRLDGLAVNDVLWRGLCQYHNGFAREVLDES